MNLVVQFWGIGNLVQTEPLLRELEQGTLLVYQTRATKELAPFFPKWQFVTELSPTSLFEDTYVCFPVDGREFARVTNRIHFPAWCFRKWKHPEWRVLLDMATREEASPPRLEFPDPPPLEEKTIALSIGYLKQEAGWQNKHWGNQNFVAAIEALKREGYKPIVLGNWADYETDGKVIGEQAPGVEMLFRLSLWQQVLRLGSAEAYLGNDTGMAHVAGALGKPCAVYTVTDRVKNRPSGKEVLQFGGELPPREAVSWLKEVLNAQSPRAKAEATG